MLAVTATVVVFFGFVSVFVFVFVDVVANGKRRLCVYVCHDSLEMV